ncbi:MAG: hypothetical protein KF846_10350 [Cyclobacteriaceae bacterium]|nr:hypothetical protein [Cyclobacteriaceae bacterium]
MQEDYSKIHKDLSTVQLLDLLDNKESYHPDAILSAESELTSRQLSSTEINEARQIIEQKSIQRSKSLTKTVESKVNYKISKIIDHINPLTKKTPEQVIRLLSVLIAVGLLYRIVTDFGFFQLMLSDIANWDLSSVIWFAPYIYLPATIIFLLAKRKAGWTMLTIWLTYTTASIFFAYYQERKFASSFSTESDGIFQLIETPTYGLAYYLIQAAIFLSIAYYLNTQTIKTLYSIDRVTAIASMTFGVVGATLLWYPLLTS